MTNCSGFVPSYPIASGSCRFFESLAMQYWYSDGGSARRAAMRGRFAGVLYDEQTCTFARQGFTDGGTTGVLAGGVHRFMLEPGTVAVCPETISGSPVSGQAFVVTVHPGKHPFVDMNVPVSGIWGRLIQLKKSEEAELPAQVSRPPTVRITRVEPQRPPKPELCRNCQSRSIAWDHESDDWKCHTCQRPQTRV